MNFRISISIFFLLFGCSYCYAQEANELVMDQLFEQLLEELDADVDASEITEKWTYYLKHPIDLNKTDGKEFSELLFLSPIQIENFLGHRRESGDFISLQELQSIDGFDIRTIQYLLPFVTISNLSSYHDFSMQKLLKKSDQELMIRYSRILNQQKGFTIEDTTRSRYLGDPNRILLRYRLNYNNNIRLSINMDKDAGEPFFKEKQKYGFDFYSASLLIKDLGKVKQVVIGDYALQIGQGLTIWNGLSFGKGAMVQNTARQGIGLKSYSSLNEANFLRGVASTIRINNFEVTPYISYRKIDGRVEERDGERFVSTLAISGLHRTPTEQLYRREVGQFVYGTNVLYAKNRLKVGANFISTHLDASKTLGNSLENRFDFEGKSVQNLSLYYNYSYRNSYLFGEVASNLDKGYAWLTGVVSSLTPKFSTIILYRDYQKDYHSFFSQTVGETAGTNNEKGMYAGIVFHPSRKIQWTTYFDMFKFPWLRYRASAPSSGYDILSQFSYIWYKKGQLSLRFRYRLREENSSLLTTSEDLLAEVKKYQIRLEYKYKLNDVWSIRSRAEGIQYQKEFEDKEYGWMLYQDVFWAPKRSKLSANIRIAYFNTDSYNTRIYAYENDVLYSSSFPLYYQNGWRAYGNCRVRLSKNIDVWAKIASYYYPKLETIGTGLDEINGKVKAEAKLQLRMQF